MPSPQPATRCRRGSTPKIPPTGSCPPAGGFSSSVNPRVFALTPGCASATSWAVTMTRCWPRSSRTVRTGTPRCAGWTPRWPRPASWAWAPTWRSCVACSLMPRCRPESWTPGWWPAASHPAHTCLTRYSPRPHCVPCWHWNPPGRWWIRSRCPAAGGSASPPGPVGGYRRSGSTRSRSEPGAGPPAPSW